MAGIAVAKLSGLHVEHADEERDEHVRIVHVGHCLVDGRDDALG